MTRHRLAKSLHFVLPEGVRATMVIQAMEERPMECCGLLAGRFHPWGWEAETAFPLVNELKSATRFRSEPGSLIAALRLISHRGLEVVAIYHSHPNTPAFPSTTDLTWRWAEGVADLIISLARTPPDVRAWQLSDRHFEEIYLLGTVPALA